jgi:hypothetical protein
MSQKHGWRNQIQSFKSTYTLQLKSSKGSQRVKRLVASIMVLPPFVINNSSTQTDWRTSSVSRNYVVARKKKYLAWKTC